MEGKEKKKGKWKIYLSAFLVLFLLGSCVGAFNSAEVRKAERTQEIKEANLQKQKEITQETLKESTIETTKETVHSSSADATIDKEIARKLFDDVVSLSAKNNYENCEIEINEDSYIIKVWNKGVAQGANFAKAGDQKTIDAWNNVKDSIKQLDENLQKSADELGTDYIVSVWVMNDENIDNVLLSYVAGVLFYDVVAD